MVTGSHQPEPSAWLIRQTACNFYRESGVGIDNSTKDSTVGNGNSDVGKAGPTRKLRRPSVESLARPDGFPQLRIDGRGPVKADRERICGAMSQQHGDSGRGNESVPQKLVHLVGYRDPNARTEPWVRPRPASLKP